MTLNALEVGITIYFCLGVILYFIARDKDKYVFPLAIPIAAIIFGIVWLPAITMEILTDE